MLLIVAHHYVVNSGLLQEAIKEPTAAKSIIFMTIGMWGKTGINCFVLITGYFMCESKITLQKFLKLLLEVELYSVVFGILFILAGYNSLSLSSILDILSPIHNVKDGFTSCFLLFFLFIPFLNILIQNLEQKLHLLLLALSVGIYTIIGSSYFYGVTFNYITWFCVLYFIASYIRLYPIYKGTDIRFWGYCSLATILIACASMISILFASQWLNKPFMADMAYYFVADSNKILAVSVAVSTFMFFKNLNIKHNKLINTIAASTFGVLLIHANSDAMRQWLWRDTLQNVRFFHTEYAYYHVILAVLTIYFGCTLIDYLRIRIIEKPMVDTAMKLIDQIKAKI